MPTGWDCSTTTLLPCCQLSHSEVEWSIPTERYANYLVIMVPGRYPISLGKKYVKHADSA